MVAAARPGGARVGGRIVPPDSGVTGENRANAGWNSWMIEMVEKTQVIIYVTYLNIRRIVES